MENLWICDLHTRPNDFDMLSHMNNSVYHELIEIAKSNFVRDFLGINPFKNPSVLIHSDTNYLKPVKMTDQVIAEVALVEAGNTSFTMKINITDARNRDKVFVKSTHKQVLFDPLRGKAKKIPEDMINIAKEKCPGFKVKGVVTEE